MEPDRYKNHHTLYILGIISLILAISLLFFSLYILPFFIWHLDYNVPEQIVYLSTFFQDKYDYTVTKSNILVWLVFFVPGIIFGIISNYISNYIDNEIYHINMEQTEEERELSSSEVKKQIKESASLGLKIISLMIIIVLIVLLLQLFIQFTA